MNYEILIFLFILFSVISTIINKIQEYRRHQTENSSQNKSPNKRDLSTSPLEDEFEYLEQESFELDREHRGVLDVLTAQLDNCSQTMKLKSASSFFPRENHKS